MLYTLVRLVVCMQNRIGKCTVHGEREIFKYRGAPETLCDIEKLNFLSFVRRPKAGGS